jgi:pseudouridine synthase
LTQALLHPKYEKEKEYLVTVTGAVQEDALKQRLQQGVELVDVSKKSTAGINHKEENDNDNDTPKQTFVAKADVLQVKSVPPSQVEPYLQDIRHNLPPEYNVTDLNIRGFLDVLQATELSEVRLVVSEGKHRMVRRMLATCGHPVVSLKRERMGVISLGNLKEGSFRNLTRTEEEWAQGIVDSLDQQQYYNT